MFGRLFGALQTLKNEGRGDWGEGPDLLTFLKRFSTEELHTLYAPLMESYGKRSLKSSP